MRTFAPDGFDVMLIFPAVTVVAGGTLTDGFSVDAVADGFVVLVLGEAEDGVEEFCVSSTVDGLRSSK